MNDVSVVCADSIEWMKQQPDNLVAMIIADPPYNLKKEYGNDSDHRDVDEAAVFLRQWVTEAVRLLKPNGTMYVFMGFRHIANLYQQLDSSKLNFLNWICWHYTQGIGKKRGFSPRHDDILVFSKGPNFVFNLDAIRVPQKYYRSVNNMRGANPGDVWEFSHIHYCQDNRQAHPTQKPEGLIERMVRASSNSGDLVLDPFLGSGTTARVCQQLGRRCIGVEVNPDYADMSLQRLAQPFAGFDSVDPRMKRMPFDMRDPELRETYIQNHINWFLEKHENDVKDFLKEVESLYGARGSNSMRKIRRGKVPPEPSGSLFSG